MKTGMKKRELKVSTGCQDADCGGRRRGNSGHTGCAEPGGLQVEVSRGRWTKSRGLRREVWTRDEELEGFAGKCQPFSREV